MEARALLEQYYAWLDANPQFKGMHLWRVPIPVHLQAIAIAECEVRMLYGTGGPSKMPRGILDGAA